MQARELPPLNWLRSFEAAARLLSFTAAAEELHITQSAVSQQVKLLEQFLGQSMFIRRPRSLLLTEAARNYLPTVEQAFRVLRDGTRDFIKQPTGSSLEIKSNVAFSVFWMMPRLGRFFELHPEISVHVSTAFSTTDFAGANASVEIRYGRGEWEDVDSTQLNQEHVYPVCSPTVAARLSTPLDLENETLLHLLYHVDGWDFWLRGADVAHRDSSAGHYFSTFVLAYNMAQQGHGIALGHDILCADLIDAGLLVEPFEIRVSAQDNYYVVLPKGDQSSDHALVFRDWILSEFGL